MFFIYTYAAMCYSSEGSTSAARLAAGRNLRGEFVGSCKGTLLTSPDHIVQAGQTSVRLNQWNLAHHRPFGFASLLLG